MKKFWAILIDILAVIIFTTAVDLIVIRVIDTTADLYAAFGVFFAGILVDFALTGLVITATKKLYKK